MSDAVYETMKRRIIGMHLEPGSRLNVDIICADLGVSHTPVREALRRLAAEELVRGEPFKGFIVEPLLDIEMLEHLLETRRVLEEHASRLTAVRASDEDLEACQDSIDQMDACLTSDDKPVDEFNRADAAFHHTIVKAAGNPVLFQAYTSLHAHVRVARSFRENSGAYAVRANEEHRALLASLLGGDPDQSAQLAHDHVQRTLVYLKELEQSRQADAGGAIPPAG